jgi:hypothetical protein
MTILIISLLLTIFTALGYVIFNLSNKITLYEQTIQQFYEDASIILHTMRALDEKQMFETDDEVGEVFAQLTDIISMLRPILYGQEQDDTEKN